MHLRTLLFLFALGIARSAHAQESACGCDDVRDMRNRLCIARAAISEYDRHIPKIREQERQANKIVVASEANYEGKVQKCVQDAIDRVKDTGARSPPAATNNACETTFEGSPTACMKEILTSHENVHVSVCQKAKLEKQDAGLWAEFKGNFENSRANQSLINLLNEERAAYAVEMVHIRDQLDRLILTSHCAGLPTRQPGPGRIYTPEPCPPPKQLKDEQCPVGLR